MVRAQERAVSAPGSSTTAAVLGGQEAIKGWQEDLYRALHQHPELPNQEVTTAATAAATLRDAGHEVHEKVGTTGVVGIVRNGDGPTVLVRADMDALPICEQTGLPYASTEQHTDAAGKRSVPTPGQSAGSRASSRSSVARTTSPCARQRS